MTIDDLLTQPIMKFTDADRYRYSVLWVCEHLSGAITGSSDPMTDEEIGQLGEWLAWRTTDGWLPTSSQMSMACHRYNQAVRNLARATLIMVMSR